MPNLQLATEVRAHEDGDAMYLKGVAAPFDVEISLPYGVRESIAPGAFAEVIEGDSDILALVDHRATEVIGRRANKSLSLWETETGLEYEIRLPHTQQGLDLYIMARDGYLGGISIGWRDGVRSAREKIVRWSKITLREVSVVRSIPAYPTSVLARGEARMMYADDEVWDEPEVAGQPEEDTRKSNALAFVESLEA